MHSAGLNPGRIEAGTPGFIRFSAPGDSGKKQNGFYKLSLGKWPSGWFGDWKDGGTVEWSWWDDKKSELTEHELAQMRKDRAAKRAEAAQEREARQAEVAEDASAIWKRGTTDALGGHPYLVSKSIEDPRALRVFTNDDVYPWDTGEPLILVPMMAFDMGGKAVLTNLQFIGPDGQKRFMAGGRIEGCFFYLKGDPELTVVCEGVATGFKIWEATGLTVVVAFNAGNLLSVVRDYQRNRPMAQLLLAGDDDVLPSSGWLAEQERRKSEGKAPRQWVNAGRVKAIDTAEKTGIRAIWPVFADGPDRSRTDFDDLFRIEGRQAVAGQIIGALRSVEPETCAPGEQTTDVPPDRLQDESWRQAIPTTSNGSYDGNNIEGVAVMIGNHRLLKERLRYNAWTKEMELDGNPLEGHHVGAFRRVMHFERLKARKSDVQDEMEAEARRHSFDPLTDYLQALKWDGTHRLDTWTGVYLGTERTPYASAIGRKFLIGAVARALQPGCKNDNMLVLEGPQGIGKSTAVRYLFGDRFFTDNLPDFHSKDSFQQLQGAWCIEVGELSALSKAEVKDVKQFLSRLVDKFRAPYERIPLSIPRRTVFVGTVNPEDVGYLRDPTGNRRFWPIECSADPDLGVMPLRQILADRDQIWAEAVAAYKRGEEWHLEEDDAAVARVEQDKRREMHPWEPVIAAWAKREAVYETTIAEVLEFAIKIAPDKLNSQAQRGAGAALRGLGWVPEGAKRLTPGAPPVKVFKRPDGSDERLQFIADAMGDDDVPL